jgi:hypothetical protein
MYTVIKGWLVVVFVASFVVHISISLFLYRLKFTVKKEGWGGGGQREVRFVRGQSDMAVLKSSGKTVTITIGPGLPKDSSESFFSTVVCGTAFYDPFILAVNNLLCVCFFLV